MPYIKLHFAEPGYSTSCLGIWNLVSSNSDFTLASEILHEPRGSYLTPSGVHLAARLPLDLHNLWIFLLRLRSPGQLSMKMFRMMAFTRDVAICLNHDRPNGISRLCLLEISSFANCAGFDFDVDLPGISWSKLDIVGDVPHASPTNPWKPMGLERKCINGIEATVSRIPWQLDFFSSKCVSFSYLPWSIHATLMGAISGVSGQPTLVYRSSSHRSRTQASSAHLPVLLLLASTLHRLDCKISKSTSLGESLTAPTTTRHSRKRVPCLRHKGLIGHTDIHISVDDSSRALSEPPCESASCISQASTRPLLPTYGGQLPRRGSCDEFDENGARNKSANSVNISLRLTHFQSRRSQIFPGTALPH
ncbi:uncharacterized protein CLUP02_01196 [Colletotrichum lupini]|uniref:Uncharacterized protein n=1 Tax=Colletotrichum lupini TaxID=145971 RepID=A0A9Q8SCL4_9PEZI|nr:uncharacterized protein CLUP02_01196 [Colletotrichum lupini]UQC74545.1 hypothetical protein CLUP02_01196 [Colletotrichum lupini]